MLLKYYIYITIYSSANNTMNLIRLTSENSSRYVGHSILFNSRGKIQFSKILAVSNTGKSLTIQHQDLGGRLECVTRAIYVVMEA